MTNEQGRMVIEMTAEITTMKVAITAMNDNFLEMKEMLRNLKKCDKSSEGGENSMSNLVHNPKFEDEEETRAYPQGWLSRTVNFFEIQKVMEKEKLRLAYISMDSNAGHWFNFWRKNSNNPSRREFYIALTQRFDGKGRIQSLRSWQD